MSLQTPVSRIAPVLVILLALGASSAPGAVEVLPECTPRAAIGSFYTVTFSAQGGVAPYTFSLSSGSIPPGMTLSPSFTLSGTPSTPGWYGFEVSARDSVGDTGRQAYVLVVEDRWNILVGAGLGAPSPNRVRVFDASGSATPTDFLAYGAGQWGVNVAGGNIDGGATWEILTAPGPGTVYGPQIRGFRADGMSLAKVNFYAYGTLKFGANVAAGDIDGDWLDEIIVAPGPGAVFGPHIRAFNFDGGALTAIQKVNYFAYGTLKFGANIAAGDVDGDCIDEILTGAGPSNIFAPTVRGWNYDGQLLTSISKLNFNAFGTSGYGVNLAVGDVDNDHYDEIVAAPGPGPSLPNRFLGFNYDGVAVSLLPGYDVTPFPTYYGGEPGLADVGDPAGSIRGGEDLLAAPGPDPAAPADIKIYAYSGTSLIEIVPPSPFTAFPGQGYGANPAGAKLGF